MRLFSNPNKTSSGFQILPTGKCNRKKFFLDATALTASSKKAGYDAERGKNRKPVRADVDCVSNAAMGSTIKIFRRKKLKTTESSSAASMVACTRMAFRCRCTSTLLKLGMKVKMKKSKAKQSKAPRTDKPPEIALDPGRKRLAAVNSDHPDDAGLAFGKHEHHRKSGHNTHCKMSNKRYKRSEVMDHALKQLSRNHSSTAKFDPIRAHVQAQKDTGHLRWLLRYGRSTVTSATGWSTWIFGRIGKGESSLAGSSKKVMEYYAVNGRSPGVYYGAGCANARGKGERGGSPVDAQMRAMSTKTTNERRTSRPCPCCRKVEVEVVPRARSRRMRCINLGSAAF